MKRIHTFKNFKLIKEADEADKSDDDFTFDEENNKGESGSNEENEGIDDNEEDSSENNEEEEEEVEEEPNDDKVYNESPAYYIKQSLKQIENKIVSLFNPPKENERGRTNKDESSYHSQGVEILDVKTTDMDMNKTLMIKYHDTDFIYHLMFSMKLEQGMPEKADIEMDHSMIDFCGVKFKKYDNDNKLLGELDRKKVNISTIDQDFIDTLNGEMDSKYSIDDGFEIEYKDED